ncbi:ATP-binding protein [Halobellus sp. EA9]|uniref:ATP-binding protein n=1 Tax=Halobellus sp. EA9 TaxID=3421647 RepID=UPI003EBE9CD4
MNVTDRLEPGGLLIAISGFGVTRFFVAETLRTDAALPFLVAGLLPLVVGLGLSVYGVVLTVGPFESDYVNTVARWHVLGVAAMAVVFGITAVDQLLRTGAITVGREAPLLVANVLLGGAIGGTLTGVQSGRAFRQQQEIQRSANRALLVNRLLQHEVVNAITIIGGHTDVLSSTEGGRPASTAAIQRAIDRIRNTIEEVGVVARDADRSTRTDLERIVRAEVEAIREAYDVDPELAVDAEDTTIVGDDRLSLVVRELLTNAATHGDAPSITITERLHALELTVADDGPGLPQRQRSLLETGQFPEFDDPSAGFGLQIIRLLVTQFGGTIRVSSGESGDGRTEIAVAFPRTERERIRPESIGLGVSTLIGAIVAGLVGGVAMGAYFQLTAGVLPVIGSLYGIESPLVGWITHLFHSAIFGLLFAAGVAAPGLRRYASWPGGSGVLGLLWGVVLWLVAAGILMPLWLQLLGIPAALPNLSVIGLVAHAIWGTVMGITHPLVSGADPARVLHRVRRWLR